MSADGLAIQQTVLLARSSACMRQLKRCAPGREEGLCFEAALHQQQGADLRAKRSLLRAHACVPVAAPPSTLMCNQSFSVLQGF